MIDPVYRMTGDGYFARGNERIIPYGVNYWPSSCGVEMWQVWPEQEILHDLDTMKSIGLNCIRFFIRWEDFEPTLEEYDAAMFKKLSLLMTWCGERELLMQPTLFVGWMSGGIFWPEWKKKSNLFSDRLMRERSFSLARQSSKVIARHREWVLAIDLGNEICCLPDCLEAPPEDVESWCSKVTQSIRFAFPDVLIISGNEQAQVTKDTGWRFDRQEGCDLYSMHTYPNSDWHPLRFDGMKDPLGQSLFPFYVKCARVFGPVIAQEFGTIFTSSLCCSEYLDEILPACWEAGANGFLWWSLRDFTAKGHPYDKNAFEGPLGLVNEKDQIKETLQAFSRFVESLPDREKPVVDQGEIALYWPKHYYDRDQPKNPGNKPRELSRRMIVAHYVLSKLGFRVGIVRGGLPLDGISASTIVVCGAALDREEVVALEQWTQQGGRVLFQGVDVTTYGTDMNRFLGADAADLWAPRAKGVEVFGELWDFVHFPRNVFTGVEATTAKVMATDSLGRAIVLWNRCGKGSVASCMAQPDDMFADESDDRSVRKRWFSWYKGMLSLVDYKSFEDSSCL